MNLYSPNIIKNDFHFNVATYSINRHTHEETLSTIMMMRILTKAELPAL